MFSCHGVRNEAVKRNIIWTTSHTIVTRTEKCHGSATLSLSATLQPQCSVCHQTASSRYCKLDTLLIPPNYIGVGIEHLGVSMVKAHIQKTVSPDYPNFELEGFSHRWLIQSQSHRVVKMQSRRNWPQSQRRKRLIQAHGLVESQDAIKCLPARQTWSGISEQRRPIPHPDCKFP